jgi:hypothetical protein
MEQLGLGRHRPDLQTKYRWDYASLANPPDIAGEPPRLASIYRGLVPAKNILNHDFAVNGAMVCLFFTASLIQKTRKLITTVYRSPLWTHQILNSFLRITHMCARCLPIGFRHTFEATCCGFPGALGRHSTLRSMMWNGYKDGTRIL